MGIIRAHCSGEIMQELAEFTAANALLVSGLIASVLAVLFYELRLRSREIGSVSTVVAVRIINDGVAVIDLRPAEQYAAGHIVAARNIPEAELLKDPAQLAKHKKGALLVCDSGARSAGVAAQLRKAGTENVFSIKGGLAAWQQENLPVVRDTAS
jgi:rhodanese-related sulfurtransferase